MPPFDDPTRQAFNSDEEGGAFEKHGHRLPRRLPRRLPLLDAPILDDRLPDTARDPHASAWGTPHRARQAGGDAAGGTPEPIPGDHRPRDIAVSLDVAEETLATARQDGLAPPDGAERGDGDPPMLFDVDWYRRRYADLAEVSDLLGHYLRHGAGELRSPHPLFDAEWYVGHSPDIAGCGLDPLAHYTRFGRFEGRSPHPLLSPPFQRQRNGRLVDAFAYREEVRAQDPHALFSVEHYLATRADRPRYERNALVDYLKHGACDAPNPFFDGRWYLARYGDVAAAGWNPLVHYLLHGADEGRDPGPLFSTAFYRDSNADVRSSGVNPLEHFLAFGRAEGRAPLPPRPARDGEPCDFRRAVSSRCEVRLRSFLASGRVLRFARCDAPLLSIVIAVHDKAHFTFCCLDSLASVLRDAAFGYEIIVFDDDSRDGTGALLRRTENLRVIGSATNVGFLEAVNRSVAEARGGALLLLNNDTELGDGAIEAALARLQDPTVGAVGGKLILPDGLLQEAGNILWSDGTCLGYARGEPPESPIANFTRDVDFCSGAFLLTGTDLFRDVGGFDEAFKPAYYEEVDYCLALRERGLRVVYDPAVTVFHFEFASSDRQWAVSQQETNRRRLLAKHALARQPDHGSAPTPDAILAARTRGPRRQRVLLIDDLVPLAHLGSGLPRTREVLASLVALDCEVTFFPTDDAGLDWALVRTVVDPAVEVVTGLRRAGLPGFIASRPAHYDLVIVSRPHNMTAFNDCIGTFTRRPRILYDAEAIFADRAIGMRRLAGEAVSAAAGEAMVGEETRVAERADAVMCVTRHDADRFAARTGKPTREVGYPLSASPGATPYVERQDLLFVGAVHDEGTPNADSIRWLASEIMPRLRLLMGAPRLLIAGRVAPEGLRALATDDIRFLGVVDDLDALFARCRVFVAPTRFAAGIPLKVLDASIRGLPAVITAVLARQLRWADRREALVASELDPDAFAAACRDLYTQPELWRDVRTRAIAAAASTCDRTRFSQALRDLLDTEDRNPDLAARSRVA